MKEVNRSILITVSGRVQGVAFRHYTVKKAVELELTGYVRNLYDGRTVEILAEGTEESLNDLLEWANIGPGSAVVDNVRTLWDDASGQYDCFSIRY